MEIRPLTQSVSFLTPSLFEITALTPLAAATLEPTSNIVKMMIGIEGSFWCSIEAASIPFSLGILKSRSIRSGETPDAFSTASTPSTASAQTAKPADRLYAADALRTMGDRRGGEGDIDGARELYQRAIDLLAPLGEHEKTGVVFNNMAIGYEFQGHITQAEKLFRQAASTWTECGDLLHAGVALGNVGDILIMRGQLRRAEKQYTLAKEQIEVTSPDTVAYELYSIAVIRSYEGDMAGAKLLCDQALILARRRKWNQDIASADQVLGTIQIAAGDLPGARSSFREALNLWQSRGQKVGITESDAALAEVSLETGEPYKAEQALRKALDEFRAETAVSDEIQTETDLSRALLAEGKLAGARQTIADAQALSRSTSDPAVKLPVTIMDARIQTAELSASAHAISKPTFAVPRRKLLSVIATARNLGYYEVQCDARLALAEIELRQNSSSARAQLSELAQEARAHGLDLVSRKATTLADSATASPHHVVSDDRDRHSHSPNGHS